MHVGRGIWIRAPLIAFQTCRFKRALKCKRGHAHRDGPGVAERAPLVALKHTTTSQNIKLGTQRLVRAYERRRSRAAEVSSMIELDCWRGFRWREKKRRGVKAYMRRSRRRTKVILRLGPGLGKRGHCGLGFATRTVLFGGLFQALQSGVVCAR